jgi:D-sedoheptulose 7-phosphate isomerase
MGLVFAIGTLCFEVAERIPTFFLHSEIVERNAMKTTTAPLVIDREDFSLGYIETLCGVLNDLPIKDLVRFLKLLERAFTERRQVFIAGNGGSAATASHMANDMAKGVAEVGGRGLRAIALSDNVPLITAIANDKSYSEIFADQLLALGQPGDVLIVISGSGNSANIVRAVKVAQEMEIATMALLGMGGGQVAKMADASIVVPSDDYGPIEDVHMVLDHLVTAYMRNWLANAV